MNFSGKFVSENHYKAKQEGKLTAGEAAKIISKRTGKKYLAKDIIPLCTEWHHSGLYKKEKKFVMGKTWFITKEHVEEIIRKQAPMLF